MQLHERSTPLNTSHMGEPSRRKSNARTSNPSTQFHHTHHVTDRSKAMSEDRSRVSQQQVHNPRKFLRKVQKATENRQPTTPLNSMVDGTNKPDALPIRNRHGQDNFRGVCQTVYHNRNLCSALSFKPARVKEIGSIDSVVPTCVHGQNTSDKRRPKSARSAHHRPGRFLSQGLSQSGYGGWNHQPDKQTTFVTVLLLEKKLDVVGSQHYRRGWLLFSFSNSVKQDTPKRFASNVWDVEMGCPNIWTWHVDKSSSKLLYLWWSNVSVQNHQLLFPSISAGWVV